MQVMFNVFMGVEIAAFMFILTSLNFDVDDANRLKFISHYYFHHRESCYTLSSYNVSITGEFLFSSIGVSRAPGGPHTTHSGGGCSVSGTPGETHKSPGCLTHRAILCRFIAGHRTFLQCLGCY